MDIISPPTIPEPSGQGEPLKGNTDHVLSDTTDIEPIDEFAKHDDPVLHCLGIADEVGHLPDSAKENLKEVRQYVQESLKVEGKQDTIQAFQNKLESLKWELGFDNDTDPSVIIDKIANIVKSWRSLSFIRNPAEKRSILMKLGRAKTNEEMDQIVYKSMEDHKVWR